MTRVEESKIWEINSMEDYEKAMDILEGNLFIASMSDDYYWYSRETEEANRQIREVKRQAREKGFIQ